MKKIIILINLLLPTLFFADDFKNYDLPDIDIENQGYYLPEVYLEELPVTKSHPIAMSKVKNNTHNLVVSQNRINLIASYHDGAAVSLGRYMKFNFDEGYLIDDTGAKYIKIAAFNTDDYDSIYKKLVELTSKLLLKTMFDEDAEYKNSDSTLSVSNDFASIVLNDEKYKPNLDVVFTHQKYTTFKDNIAIEITESEIVIHKLLPASEGPGISDNTEVITRFKL